MKLTILVLLIWVSSFGLVGNFDDSNLTIGLFNQPAGTASKNIGTVIPVKGPNAPQSVTATFDRVPETYGWRSDLQSYRFDSTTSNIMFSKNIGSLAENKLTVACWLKMKDLNWEKNIWAKVVDVATKIVIHRQHTDTFEIRVCDGSSSSFIDFLRPAGNAEPNSWFSLITVIDVTQTQNADRIKVYVNGIPCAIAGTPGEIPAALPNLDAVPLRVGGWGADPKVGINGEMKYMITFNTAKTAADVSALYALGPDLGGLALDSAGKLYSTVTYVAYNHRNSLESARILPGGMNQKSYGVFNLSGRKINSPVMTGSAAWNHNQSLQSGRSSGFYLVRKIEAQSGEVSRQSAVFFGN